MARVRAVQRVACWGKMRSSRGRYGSVMNHLFRVFALACTLLIVACRPAQPSEEYRTGDVLLEEDFSQPFAWETHRSADGLTALRIEDDVYRMTLQGPGYNWANNLQTHTDVVIEVYASQLVPNAKDAFGVVCRANPGGEGSGYYFYITADGYWSIRRAQGRTVTSLVDFTRSDAINTGQSLNFIRALCIEDYLALYVNDQFLGEVRDRNFVSGVAGFSLAVPNEITGDVSFDNLRIIEARLLD
jgi:hypothetical protein